MLNIRNLFFRYNEAKIPVFKDFSYSIKRGEIVSISGKNGCGKTTLLYIICGIIPTYFSGDLQGEILLDGNNIREKSFKEIALQVNMLFQNPDYQLIMPVVEEEIAFAPENYSFPKDKIIDRMEKVLDMMQISHLRYRETNTLSYGEKKLVALASVLVTSPETVLIDEFSAGISSKSIQVFKNAVKELAGEGTTFIIADHNTNLINWTERNIDLD